MLFSSSKVLLNGASELETCLETNEGKILEGWPKISKILGRHPIASVSETIKGEGLNCPRHIVIEHFRPISAGISITH